MPRRQTISDFVDLVTGGQFVEAMERFYAEDATVQENCAPPRVGRKALIEHELATLSAFKGIRGRAVDPPLIDGNRVVIHWQFEFDHPVGGTVRLDELADQRWAGERLKSERFFYDPAQLATPLPMEEPPSP